MPIGTALAIAGTAAKLATLPGSFKAQRKMEGELSSLRSRPMARYTIDPKVENLYRQSMNEASNPEGFGGAAFGGFRNSLGRNIRGRYANALSLGGGARGVNAVLNSQGMDQIGNFYTADENMRRSNRLGALGRSQGYANQFQNIRNQNTSFDQNYRMNLERGLGEGIRSQKDFRRNMLGGMGSDLITAGIGYGMDKNGGGATQDNLSNKQFAAMNPGNQVDPRLLNASSRRALGRNPFYDNSTSGGTLTTDVPTRFTGG